MGKLKINKEELISLVNQGLTDREIAEKLKVKPISVYFSRKRNNIIRESYNLAKRIELTELQKQFIVGCLLGDGNLRLDKGCINPRFSCEHGSQQKEYCEYKYSILEGLEPKIRHSKRLTADKRNGIYYDSSIVRTNSNPELLWFYNQFYQPTKIITEEVLQYYTPFAIAIHYMDDGWLSANGYYIATNSFDVNSINILRKYLLETYNIKTSIHKGNRLYIKSESKNIFTSLIKEYFIPEMMYKIHNE